MGKSRPQSKKSRKPLIIAGSIVLFGLVAYGGYRLYKYNQPHVSPSPTPTITSLPGSTSTSGDKSIDSSTSHSGSIGGATDNHGSGTDVSTAPNTWTRSQSGVITVKAPVVNSTIKSGVQLIGSASTSSVQYRLTDDNVGVISQGTISVVNGDFSATVNFTSAGKTGRLDVFTTDNNDKEINEVQLQVGF